MTAYIKWIGRRNELIDDKERGYPVAYLGRAMATHGEDFEQDSEFGNCLLSMGRANERIAGIQESYVDCATATWLDNLERSLAMMKEYQVCCKQSVDSADDQPLTKNRPLARSSRADDLPMMPALPR